MLLAAVVETSSRVAGTTKRLEKIELLAKLLRQLQPEEIEIVAAFLGGRTRQGRIGIGYESSFRRRLLRKRYVRTNYRSGGLRSRVHRLLRRFGWFGESAIH